MFLIRRHTTSESPSGHTPLARVQDNLGLSGWPPWIILCTFSIWAVVFLALLVGVFATLAALPTAFATTTAADPALRWTLLTLTAVTGALGAVVALPLTLIRVNATQRQTVAAEQGLVTDRINTAVASLGADKDHNRLARTVTYGLNDTKHTVFEDHKTPATLPAGAEDIHYADWQTLAQTIPNMEVRIGAILALGRIARENLAFHVQVMQILCAYVRENAPADSARTLTLPDQPPDDNENMWEEWMWIEWREQARAAIEAFRAGLTPRADIQTALEVLGRRNTDQKGKEGAWPHMPAGTAENIFGAPFPVPPEYPEQYSAQAHAAWETDMETYTSDAEDRRRAFIIIDTYRPDLRHTNLQGYNLSACDLQGADLSGAHIQGADLSDAHMQGADLSDAHMPGANLGRAQMQGADLSGAHMQGANLGRTHMQGANLNGARMSSGTNLSQATLRGAAAHDIDAETLRALEPFWQDMFADGSVRPAYETLRRATPTLPPWPPVAGWADQKLGYIALIPEKPAFHIAWRAFVAALDPPETDPNA